MSLWLPRARRVLPFALSGIALTLFVSWGLPVLLAMRGLGVGSVPARIAADASARLGTWSDTYSAPELNDATSFRAVVHRTGWPFRSFECEVLYRMRSNDEYAEPDFHRCFHVGESHGEHLVVPLRPRVIGLLVDSAFWAAVSWMAVAFPLALRKRKRMKYGLCITCGHALDDHAVTRPVLCPKCGVALVRDPLAFVRSPEMHFQNAYVWFVFVSSLDIMLTWKILSRGGMEVNPLAALIIDAWGMHGAIAFKFALMTWVIIACEFLARLRMSAGRFLAYTAVALSAFPVVWSLALLLYNELVPV